jgi:hypothetical protein
MSDEQPRAPQLVEVFEDEDADAPSLCVPLISQSTRGAAV